jgi:Transposase domain (DUF772)
VIPWARVLALTEPHYPRTDQSCQPVWLERILRIYFLQRWFNLSDPQAEDALYDSESLREMTWRRHGVSIEQIVNAALCSVELGDDYLASLGNRATNSTRVEGTARW